MASFLAQVQTIQRGLGRSAVAAAAYRSGETLIDERLEMEFDFAGRGGVEFAEVLTPATAPVAFRERQTLWNAVENSEGRRDAVPAREILLALPHELNFEQRRDLVRAFVAEHLTGRGMIADVAMHLPGHDGDQRNFHAHILVTTRRVGPEGFGAKEPAWRTPQQVREWRAGWAEIQNDHLRRHLGPDAPQVSHLSLAEQGLDSVASHHLGPAATALERRGQQTERGGHNRDIQARNETVTRLRRDYADTADRLAAEATKIDAPVNRLVDEAAKVRAGLIAERNGWEREREALAAPRIASARQIERTLLSADAASREKARLKEQAVQLRVERIRCQRLQLVAWVCNPARMIWAKHAELNALSRARSQVRQAELRYDVQSAWLRSPPGQALIAARRQPGLDQAAAAARQRRTLLRKIRRMDRRIEAATQTYDALRVARELGQRQLWVPSRSPDATRFIRDVGAPARDAVLQHPVQARWEAIERLNRGQGRSITRTLFPGR